MVTIAHRHADEYVRDPPQSHHIYLVYGTDAGLVSERSRALLQLGAGSISGPGGTLSFSGDEIASDPDLLLHEIHSLKLFDQAPSTIRIFAGARNLIPVLERVLRSGPFEARIVVEAGPLKSAAPLRKWFESQTLAVAIECYSDQPKDLLRLIVQQTSSCGGSIDSDAIEMLAQILGEDRGVSRLEIEKLCLYTNGQRPITSRDVTEVLTASSSVEGGDIIMDAILGNQDATIESLSAIPTHFSEFNAVSTNTLRHLLALHTACIQVAAGVGRDAALQNFLRSLNAFQKKKEISAGLNLEGNADTVGLVNSFYALVSETRHTGVLADVKLSHALTALARLRKERQRQNASSL